MAYQSYLWRIKNPERRRSDSKKETLRKRLRAAGILPPPEIVPTPEQQEILDQIKDGTYEPPQEFKSLRLPVSNMKKANGRIAYLKKKGILPDDEREFNEEHIYIINTIYIEYDVEAPFCKINLNLNTPEYIIWYRAKENAKKRGMDFNLDVSDMVIPEYCPYLGIKILTDIRDYNEDGYFSIDRIDSSMGYVKGNTQVISRRANTMKNSATEMELLTFAKNILRIYENNNKFNNLI